MPLPTPPPRDSSTSESLRELPMVEWRRCPVHAFLGVSVLVVKGFAPVCLPHGGPAHPVDPGELRRAAA